MNYALAREIYSGECWAIMPGVVDPLLDSARTEDFEHENRRNLSSLISSITGETIDEGGKSTSKTGKLISETNFNGVIIKSGGASSRGTKEISADLLNADKDPDVIGHFFSFDGPGGSTIGMDFMVGTLAQLTKPKVGLVERSGMAASAHFGILSQMDHVMAEHGDSEVGSIGVIAGAVGHANGSTDADNKKVYRVYATKSIHKNDAEEAAINKDDTTLLTERADKVNDKFHAMIKAKRPAMTDEQMTGKMYPASEVIGTMIDAIGTKQDAINKIIQLSTANNLTINNKSKTAMNKAEFKAAHPETYNEILGEGVAAGIAGERDRVGPWLAHLSTDPEAVKTGIEGKAEITATARENFLVKAASKGKLEDLKLDSNGNVITRESTNVEKTEAASFYEGVLGKLIKK